MADVTNVLAVLTGASTDYICSIPERNVEF